MPVASQLEISNLAISHLPAAPIASVNENSLEARECRRFYPQVMSDMLEGEHDWSFANQRTVLALFSTNDRDDEWAYSYAVPSNVGNPIRVLPDFDALGLSLPVPIPGEPYAETWAAFGGGYETPYLIENGKLYSNQPGATLEFTISTISGLNVTQLVVRATALDLASRIMMPIKKDSDRETKLMTLAEHAWQRAIADDRNRHPQRYGEYVSEAIAARHGYYIGAY